jgi:hypothetical protein
MSSELQFIFGTAMSHDFSLILSWYIQFGTSKLTMFDVDKDSTLHLSEILLSTPQRKGYSNMHLV